MDFFFTQTLSGTFPSSISKSGRREIRWPEVGGGNFGGVICFWNWLESGSDGQFD